MSHCTPDKLAGPEQQAVRFSPHPSRSLEDPCPQMESVLRSDPSLDATSTSTFDDACPVAATVIESDERYAIQIPQAPAGAAQWEGQSVEWPSGYDYASTCPAQLAYIKFKVEIEGTNDVARFEIPAADVPILKEVDLGYTVFGQPMAKYRLPELIYNSTDGNYSIYGGLVSVTCHSELRQISSYVFGVEIVIGRSWNYESAGGVRRNSTPQPPLFGGSSGWAYRDNSRSFDAGSDSGWFDALSAWVNNGSCTVGWDIFVDGVQVCRKDGVNVE